MVGMGLRKVSSDFVKVPLHKTTLSGTWDVKGLLQAGKLCGCLKADLIKLLETPISEAATGTGNSRHSNNAVSLRR